MRLTEGRNTGFQKIIKALEQNGSPLPIFETDEERLSFAVTLFKHPKFKDGGVINGVINGVIKKLSDNEIMILSCMLDDSSITKKHISEKTEIPERTIDRIIADLKLRQIIERQGSNKNGKWVILQ